jgi:uncharacterized membrane protein
MNLDAAHIHLIVNHVPVMGVLFVLVLLVVGMVRRSEEIKRVSLAFFVLVALSAAAADMSGDGAVTDVKGLPGVSDAQIEAHHNAAFCAYGGALILGVLSLATLIHFRRATQLPAWTIVVNLAIAVIVTGLMAWTAEEGGKIRHTEIRAGYTPSAASSTEAPHTP